ncbi:MAG TPA: hypothetical protein VHM20_01450 [Gammaproteobacteria bacterium]|jgi:hypothetical protein|nr:hypothetical protein [Gammaproteobacteria bacterium]
MFSYFYAATPDFKKPIGSKNGMEKIKISKNQPCDLTLISELNTANLNLQFAYIRTGDRLLYLNKKNSTSTPIDMEEEQLKQFDQEFKPNAIPRKLTFKELKKITNLTGHTQDSLYIEILYSGYYADPKRSIELNKLLERISFHVEYHEVPTKSSYWNLLYTYQPDLTVRITIPFSAVEKQTEEFINCKNFIEKWDPQWFPILQNRIDEILEEKFLYAFKDENHIPILSSNQNKENIQISFLYKGKGMDDRRTQMIDELLKKINYIHEQYALFYTGSAMEIQIPNTEVQNETENYLHFKTFLLLHDEEALDTVLAYENNVKSGEKILGASQTFS